MERDMRWDDLQGSNNVEDRRGEEGGGGGGGGFGFPVGGGGLGIGTIVVLGLVGWALGIDPRLLIGGAEILTGGNSQYEQPAQPRSGGSTRRTGVPSDDMGKFVSNVLGSIDTEWKDIFAKDGARYRSPTLVLYNEVTDQPCGGQAQRAMGPFYCPTDQKVYLDTSFFKEIEQRFRGCTGKSCEFAEAYVIAHEVGHHVQNLLGILPEVQKRQQRMGKVEANHLQVQVELQADCFGGVWAKHANDRTPGRIDASDIDAALRTASAIGDDKLQMQAQGRVVPDSFTHGSSEQRQRWFKTGFTQGSVEACNTFRAANL
jgi:predicted metalloprotease